MDKLTLTAIPLETLIKSPQKISVLFFFSLSFTYSSPHTCIHTQIHIILLKNFLLTSSVPVLLFPSRLKPFHPFYSLEAEKKLPLFLISFSHRHRLMLKVCLRIVCNYACLHGEALLCVKVWKPFVA